MIEKLQESRGAGFGFKVTGKLSAEDVVQISQEIGAAIAQHKKPIGLLADLSAMHGATLAARWEEMRFLDRYSDHIARFAVVSDDKWEDLAEMVVVATAAMQAETLYFQMQEILHAWHWVRMSKPDDEMPIRVMYPGRGLFQNYTPEYVGI
jgi:hypothetical protein